LVDKIEYLTLTENVASIIQKKIINGHILPGDRIIEEELSRELNVSRGPIREAFRKLEYDGLIVCESNKGCRVKTISSAEVEEIYIIRYGLEVLSTEVCEGKFSDKTIAALDMHVKQMEEAAIEHNVEALFQLDEKFHAQIVSEARLTRLYELWKSMKYVNASIFLTTYNLHDINLKKQAPAHERILNRIKTGDEDEIKQAIKSHYLNSSMIFNDSNEK